MPDYKYMCNKIESEFLTCQAEYSESCERLGSCLVTEYSMMKFSTLFECGPLPPPPMSTSCPPEIIPHFHCSFTFIYYTESKFKNKNGGALQTSLHMFSSCIILLHISVAFATHARKNRGQHKQEFLQEHFEASPEQRRIEDFTNQM